MHCRLTKEKAEPSSGLYSLMMLRVTSFRSEGAWCKRVAARIRRSVVGFRARGYASLAADADGGVVEQSDGSVRDRDGLGLAASVPTVTATTAGTLALATPVMSSRRVMATSVLFLVSRLALSTFPACATSAAIRATPASALLWKRCDATHAAPPTAPVIGPPGQRLRLRAFPACYRSADTCPAELPNGSARFPTSHLPDHTLLGAAHAGGADSDGPHAGNFVEVPVAQAAWVTGPCSPACRGTTLCDGPHRRKRAAKPTGVKVGATRTVLMNDAVVGERGTVVFIECRQPPHGHVLEHDCQQVVGIRWATR